MHRLFFALWPDVTLGRGLADAAEANSALRAAGGRAVAPVRYHLTLQFLGDFDALTPAMLHGLGIAASTVAPSPSFEFLLDRIGSFGAGRVVWMGCGAPPAELVRLHQDLGQALTAVGLASKATPVFIPHVTLRRNARGPVEQAMPPLRWRVRDFVLVDSTAGDYRIVDCWPLAGA